MGEIINGYVYAPTHVSELCDACRSGVWDAKCTAEYVGHYCIARLRWRKRQPDCGHGKLDQIEDSYAVCRVCGRVEDWWEEP